MFFLLFVHKRLFQIAVALGKHAGIFKGTVLCNALHALLIQVGTLLHRIAAGSKERQLFSRQKSRAMGGVPIILAERIYKE